MKEIVKGKFRFNKAGQGSFYTGRISSPNNENFCFAYDCGTKSGASFIRNEITKYKAELKQHNVNKLDMLVISHLDDDHVNQISFLLEDLSECSRVILPYLSPLQRLLLAFKQDDLANEEDYFSFISNPVDYLISRGVTEIIFLDGDNEEENPNQVPSNPIQPSGESQSKITVDIKLKKIPDGKLELEQTEIKKNQKVGFYLSNDKIYWGAFWEFYFHNKPQKDEAKKVAEFLVVLSKEFGKPVTEAITGLLLKEILDARGVIDKTRKVFRKIFGNLNDSGIVMLHSPVQFKNAEFIYKTGKKYYYEDYRVAKYYRHYWGLNDYCGNLLNGDISLSPYSPYPNYIKEKLQHVIVFQVPHHGSRHSWNSGVLADLNSYFPTVAVINYGWGNSHGHPGEIVLENLIDNDFKYVLNNQFTKFEYNIKSRV
ncbi:MAG TPA: hypothetical protein VKG26_03810 [Bacteroidia bacterium]|nr:hypothetical protein [Bacteroidia bacterium]